MVSLRCFRFCQIHIVLDKIYALKTIITNFVQSRKAMGESPSILLTENITAIYHKTPTKNMTGCNFFLSLITLQRAPNLHLHL